MKGEKRTTDKLKENISNTRKVIASKFKKLHKDRVSSDRKRKEKLAPVTDSLKKIISQKELIVENEQLQQPNDVNQFERMDIDPNEMDDLIQMPRHAPPPLPPLPPPIPFRTRRPPTPPPRYDSLPFRGNLNNRKNDSKPYKKLKANDQLNHDQMRNFFDNIIENNGNSGDRPSRKRRPVSESNNINIFDSNNRRNDSKIRREEAELMNLAKEDENLIDLADDQLSHGSDDGAYGHIDSVKENSPEYELSEDGDDDDHHNDVKLRIVSPDDYDDFGEYKSPGVKRSKHELVEHDADRSIKRMKSKKLMKNLRKRWQDLERTDQNNDFDERTVSRKLWKYKEYLKDISPNDFDNEGNFVGAAKRRRELAALVMELDSEKARKKTSKKWFGT